MSSTAALEDYISSFETSFVHSNQNTSTKLNFGKQVTRAFNSSLSQIFDDGKSSKKNTMFNIDDIPTKENARNISPIRSPNDSHSSMNFKDFIELTKSSKSFLQQSSLNTRSKSSIQTRDYQLNAQKSQLKQQPTINLPQNKINYNINDYLPQPTPTQISYQQIQQPSFQQQLQPNVNILDSQPFTTNVFNQNINNQVQQQQQYFMSNSQNQQSPIRVMSINHQHQQCSCQKGSLMQTQRSSACSCQYSQSSVCQSGYQSPMSTYSKNRPTSNIYQNNPYQQSCCFSNNNINNSHHQQSQNFLNQQKVQSNENTPYKNNNSFIINQTQRSHSKSPINNNNDRSLSFLKSTAQKKDGGYNTDDLIRDSESDADMHNVSSMLMDIQNNFKEGFQQIMQTSQLKQIDRKQKEQLAMEILKQSQQQDINNSQTKTLKPNKYQNIQKSPVLTIESLQTNPSQVMQTQATVQTPVSLQNINFNSTSSNQDLHSTKVGYNSQNTSQQPVQNVAQSFFQNIHQQYQSPCFNQFEDSNTQLSLPQTLGIQVKNQGNIQNQDKALKQSYSSLPVNNNKLENQICEQNLQSTFSNKQNQSTNSHKSKQIKPTINKKKTKLKIAKKKFHKEESDSCSQQEDEESCSERTSDKENNEISTSSVEEERSKSYHKKNKNKKQNNKDTQNKSKNQNTSINSIKKSQMSNKSMIKVLREMSIQTTEDNNEIEFEGGCSSFLEKSNIQVSNKQIQNDVACQYDQKENNIYVYNSRQLERPEEQEHLATFKPLNDKLPPAQKKQIAYSRLVPPHLKSQKSSGYSMPTSKNSTIRTPTNDHFHSHQPMGLDDEYLHIDDESIQHQQSYFVHSSAKTSSRQGGAASQHTNQPSQHHNSQGNINYLHYPHTGNQHNLDHFKSQCSEVIIRGSSETEISNKIQRFKNQRQISQPSIQHPQHHHSHQISGCQSLVNVGTVQNRSQFTSLESNGYSPNNINNRQLIIHEQQTIPSERDSSYNSRQQLHTGDTFMKYQQDFLDQHHNIGAINTEDEGFQSEIQYQNLQTDGEYYIDNMRSAGGNNDAQQKAFQSQNTDGNYQQSSNDQRFDTQQQQEQDEEFNYTIRLKEIKQNSHSSQRAASLPPIYGQRNQTNNQNINNNNNHLGNTSSTAGFPLQNGINSQLTGRRSTILSSFQSQKNTPLPVQTQYSERSIQQQQKLKRMSFMDKVISIQQHVRSFLQNKKQQSMAQPQFCGDSTIHRPQDDSISNMSAHLLNSLKQHLNTSSNTRFKETKVNDQSYQKNILESLNLTTGNTFIRETRLFNQGGTQQIGSSKTQGLENTSNLVLYSGSTQDNRAAKGPNEMILGQLESQPSISKPPLNLDYDTQFQHLNISQSSPNNNSSMLNLTEETNSAIFKLTPMASQNVSQKIYPNQDSRAGVSQQNNDRISGCGESNNLNYSYSEVESEWVKDHHAISPMSVNTTTSKIRNGQRISDTKQQQNHIQKLQFLKSGTSETSEQAVKNPINKINTSRQIHRSGYPPQYNNLINIEENLSPSYTNSNMVSSQSTTSIASQQQNAAIVMIQSSEMKTKNKKDVEWRLLAPIREIDLKNMLISIITQQQNNQQMLQETA